jgi:monofunctional biosynthetic peptidoglycan transglycosylase
MPNVTVFLKSCARLGLLVAISLLALQLFFVMRIAVMAVVNPQSTSFERSNIFQLSFQKKLSWRQVWTDYSSISRSLKRAIIASEDASFIDHDGVDWVAIEKAWDKNKRAEALAQKRKIERSERLLPNKSIPAPKTVGGSTITQQLAKNLFLSGERSYARKAQEYVLVVMLETLLSKQRILEIYLNHVEWGSGVFGAEAASQHYFKKPAKALLHAEAARLAVMLPAPKRYEKVFDSSSYLQSQAANIQSRMDGVEIP